MRTLSALAALLFGCASPWTGEARAQGRGGAEWTTNNSDAQRTAWVRSDPKISKDALQKPGFQFLWKMKVDAETRQLNSLTQAVLVDRIIGYRGFKSLTVVAGAGDNVYAIDNDLA